VLVEKNSDLRGEKKAITLKNHKKVKGDVGQKQCYQEGENHRELLREKTIVPRVRERPDFY